MNGITNVHYTCTNALLDGRENVVVKYEYDSWGKVLSITGSMTGTLGK